MKPISLNFLNFKKDNLYIILFFALILRLVYAIYFSPKNIGIPSGDAFGYDKLAINILKYGQLSYEVGKPTAHREPGYPIFLAVIYFLFRYNVLAVKIVQSLISVFSVYLIFLIGKELFNKKVGVVSALVASVYPAFIYYSSVILRETIVLFFLLLMIFLMIKIFDDENEKKFFYAIYFGIISSVTSLVNSVIIMVFGVLVVYYFLTKKDFKKLVIILISFSLIYGIWVYRNYKIFNKIIFGSTNGGYTFLFSTEALIQFNLSGLEQENEILSKNPIIINASKINSEVERDKYFYNEAIKYILANKKKFVLVTVKKILKYLKPIPYLKRKYGFSDTILVFLSIVSFLPMLTFGILGLFFSESNYKKNIIILVLTSFIIIYSVFWSQIRYRIPIEPYLIIFASYYVLQIINKFNNKIKNEDFINISSNVG